MTVTAFLILLTICATITSIFTEAAKKFLDAQEITYASNVLVLAVAVVIGCGGTARFAVNYQVPFTVLIGVSLALMGGANWGGALVGSD